MQAIFRLLQAAACVLAAVSIAHAQGVPLQGGPWSPGHVPVYVGPSSGLQPILQDGGPASGGAVGVGPSELSITSRGSGNGPFPNSGTGPYSSHGCFYDTFTTSPAGYHYLCFDPNAQGGGLIAYGAANGASQLPLSMIVNGATYQFPFAISGIVGPATTTVGHASCWNNAVGTLLSDCGAPPISGPSTTTVGDFAVWGNGSGTSLTDLSAAGISTNVLNARTSAYSAAPSDCGKTITLGGSSFYTLTIGATSGFGATCKLTVVNIDTGRAKTISINNTQFPNGGLLWPGQSTVIQNENGSWVVTSNPGRWVFSGPVTLYADSANGSDNGNDCLAPGTSACATVTHAAYLFCTQMFKNGYLLTIQIPTAYNQVENVSLCPYLPDTVNTATTPTITGNAIVPSSGQPVTAVNVFTPWQFSNIIFQTPSTSTCVEADINSFLYLTNVTFYTCNIAIQALYGGKIELEGPVTFKSNITASAVYTYAGAQFLSHAQTITCSGIGSVGTFTTALDNSVQVWLGSTFSGCGSVTGIRYTAQTGGGIDTNGGGSTFFPGNTAGTATSPGWYQ